MRRATNEWLGDEVEGVGQLDADFAGVGTVEVAPLIAYVEDDAVGLSDLSALV